MKKPGIFITGTDTDVGKTIVAAGLALVLRSQGWADWAKSVAASDEALEERMHRPKVRVKGTIASVWTYYTFYSNGASSHCGIDNVDLAKIDGRWKILNLSYTVQTEGCQKK